MAEKIPDFGKANQNHTPDFDPRRVYENLNKLPLIKGEYWSSMMTKLKEMFIQQLEKACEEEKSYCTKRHTTPVMTGEVKQYILDMMEKTSTIFQMEALARFVFDDNKIPTWEQINIRARLSENIFPVHLKR